MHELKERMAAFVDAHSDVYKDIALQMLPQLMAAARPEGDGGRTLIVTATSGDTGKAALSGFADAPGTGICVFYPDGGVSDVQRLQMVTQAGANVSVAAVRGNFDDIQTKVKAIFGDAALRERLSSENVRLSSANSINIGRLVPQIVYYLDAYAQLMRKGAIGAGDELEFVVPTGNFGDVLAGFYAKLMGLPVSKLVVAANENDVSFSELLSKIGWAIMSATGGSTSSLNGSFYLGMSEAVSSEELSPADTAKMFAQGLENLRAMTTAQLGDKTMLDAIIPAVESMKITLEGNPEASLNDLFRNAVTAAVEGAAKTEELVAKQGRARNLGERSLGFRDAGATSFSLIMTAFAETVAQS